MEYKFKSGVTVSGTLEQIKAISVSLGETLSTSLHRGYYHSESKSEPLKISDMTSDHIKNAILKITREHFEVLTKNKKGLSTFDFVTGYTSIGENTVLDDLFGELAIRELNPKK